jgi:hypothetical protein
MKKFISLGLALTIVLPTMLMASDEAAVGEELIAFHALSTLPPEERAALSLMTDDQLASRAGMGPTINVPVDISVNVATLTQLNTCALCKNVAQGNVGVSSQRLRF